MGDETIENSPPNVKFWLGKFFEGFEMIAGAGGTILGKCKGNA
jgi:hypothetical protein